MAAGRTCGVTLVELLAAMAVIAILFSYALPGLTHLLARNHAAITVNWLLTGIHFARHAAIVKRVTVTLCPSADGQRCGGEWHEGMIAFTDRNQDAELGSRDRVLQVFRSPANGSTIRWRSFRNRQYLQMTKDGLTNYQNGNFVYCSRDRDPRYARQVVINVAGRPRVSRDHDGDGIVEDVRGKQLKC